MTMKKKVRSPLLTCASWPLPAIGIEIIPDEILEYIFSMLPQKDGVTMFQVWLNVLLWLIVVKVSKLFKRVAPFSMTALDFSELHDESGGWQIHFDACSHI